MEKWKIQWEEILIEKLKQAGIRHEKTSFSISSDLKKLRDLDYDKMLQSGQIVDLILPQRKDGKVKLKAIDVNGLPVEVGTLNFYNSESNFKKGIVCQLIEKDLNYSNGDVRSCLEFNQPIILFDADTLPEEILSSDVLKIKEKGQERKPLKGGCIPALVVLLVLFFAVFLIIKMLS